MPPVDPPERVQKELPEKPDPSQKDEGTDSEEGTSPEPDQIDISEDGQRVAKDLPPYPRIETKDPTPPGTNLDIEI